MTPCCDAALGMKGICGLWEEGGENPIRMGEKNSICAKELNEVFTCMAERMLDSNKNANAIWITGLTAEIFAS